MSRYAPSDCKVYVGDLGSTASKADLEDAFTYYGPLRNVWVARNPPGFAFVEFEDPRDAEDAIRALDGRMVCGRRIRVEPSNGSNKGRFGQGSRSRWHPEDRCYDCGDRGHYARDCPRDRRYGSRRRSRSRSRDRRSKSRSYSRSKSRSKSRERSRSKRSRSRSRRRSRSRSRSHSRSRSAASDKRSASRSRSHSRTKDSNHKGENGKAE